MTADHLGGYVAGGDDATWYPELWTWLIHEHGVRSVIDVGCGDGQALRYFASEGCAALGVEGVPQHHERIVEHDYTSGPFAPDIDFDLAWSCEFVEHVDEACVDNFLATFACARTVLMTHAEPGQDGHHHVNCQPAGYWIEKLNAIGYRLDDRLTLQTRTLARANPSLWNHYARSGMAFTR